MIEVTFSSSSSSITIASQSQYLTGVVLLVKGLSLNEKFEVTYAHTNMTTESMLYERIGRTYGDVSVVPIPNDLFTTVGNITVTFGDKSVVVPVSSATKPTDYQANYKSDIETDSRMIAKLKSDMPTKTSQLTNDSGYLTSLPGWTKTWSGQCYGTNATISCTIPATAKTVCMFWKLNNYWSCLTMPRGSTGKMIVSDETYYAGGNITYSGTKMTYTHTGQSSNACYLGEVWYQ